MTGRAIPPARAAKEQMMSDTKRAPMDEPVAVLDAPSNVRALRGRSA